MLEVFDSYLSLLKSWTVLRFEQEGDAYLFSATAVLRDESRLSIRDYVFADGSRKYAYQWMDSDGDLRQRWDNSPHWPDISTHPHHTHLDGHMEPTASTITNLEVLLEFLDQSIP